MLKEKNNTGAFDRVQSHARQASTDLVALFTLPDGSPTKVRWTADDDLVLAPRSDVLVTFTISCIALKRETNIVYFSALTLHVRNCLIVNRYCLLIVVIGKVYTVPLFEEQNLKSNTFEPPEYP